MTDHPKTDYNTRPTPQLKTGWMIDFSRCSRETLPSKVTRLEHRYVVMTTPSGTTERVSRTWLLDALASGKASRVTKRPKPRQRLLF